MTAVSSSKSELEEITKFQEKISRSRRWALVPNSNGKMHLIDLKPYQAQVEQFFDAGKDVKFILNTRRFPPREIKIDLQSIQNSRFDKGRPTIVTIHGWQGDLTSSVNSRVTEEYLTNNHFNVISVDWSKGAGKISINEK